MMVKSQERSARWLGVGAALSLALVGCGTTQGIGASHQPASVFPPTAVNPPFSNSMDFLTMQNGFLGVNSSILSTTNGGRSWNRHPLPNQETANVIDFLTPWR